MSAVFTLPDQLTLAQLIEQAECRMKAAQLRAHAATFEMRAAVIDATVDGELDAGPSTDRANELRWVAKYAAEIAHYKRQVRS